MQGLALGRLAIDLAQELQPLTVSVALLALADDLAIEHVERGEQRGRAFALVVVRHGGRTALLEPAACDRAPAPGSSRRGTAPARARAATCTGPRCLRACRQTA